jgi:hypothetical protein
MMFWGMNLSYFGLCSYIFEWNWYVLYIYVYVYGPRTLCNAWDITKHNNIIYPFIQASSSSPPQTQPTPWR